MAQFLLIDGPVSYDEAHHLQETLLTQRIAKQIGDVVLCLEHEPVITVGRAKNARDHIRANNPLPTVDVRRGGDVTLHAPGQWVAYPIIRLDGPRQDLLDHMKRLESAVISFLQHYHLPAQRDPRNTGVWLGTPNASPLKVCSIGIACRQWVTWHGLALNWSMDLGYFQYLDPCGFDATIMTRVTDWLDNRPDTADAQRHFYTCLATALSLPAPTFHHFDATNFTQIPEFLAKTPRDE